jgi:hypothetical protein
VGIESWSPRLRRERRLRMFENRVVRKLFKPKWDDSTGEWRRLRSEELVIFTPHQILFG